MDEDRLASERDAIYGLPLDEFITERDRRVKALKDEDLRDEAAGLKQSRKPTVPAWAVNQLARQEAEAIARLLEAGKDLRAAQRRASSGRGSDELRTATRGVRDIVSDLRRRAEAILEQAGSPATGHFEDVERTLFTGAVTPEHHEPVRRGILERPLEGAGFGGVEGLLLLPSEDPGDDPDDDGEPQGQTQGHSSDDAAQADAERRAEEERRRAQERRRLQRQQRDLERSHRDQVRRAGRAAEQAEKLGARAEEATEAAADEQAEAERIAEELSNVQQELDQIADED